MTTIKATPADPAALGRATLLVHGTRGQVWTDDTTPRTTRPPQFFRTGPCPASRYGITAIIVRREA